MIRDKARTLDYFQEYIENKIKRKQKYIDRILKLPNPEEGFLNSSITLDLFSREIFLAKYSSGERVESLLNDYKESLKWFQGTYNSKSYVVQMIWMLSIGILLDIDHDDFEKLVRLVEKDNPNDYLIDFLIASQLDWERSATTFKFSMPYDNLKSIIQEEKEINSQTALRIYLEKKWFQGHKAIGSGWTENVSSKHNTYAGYWSFESAAIVKILKLNDSDLKGVKYYPYDMVHWND